LIRGNPRWNPRHPRAVAFGGGAGTAVAAQTGASVFGAGLMAQSAPRRTLARMARLQRTFYRLAIFLLVVGVLYFAQMVLIPVALAVLLAFVLTPIADWLERHRFGRVFGSVLALMLALAIVGGVGWVAGVQVQRLADELPKHRDVLAKKLQPLTNLVERFQSISELGAEGPYPPPEPEPATEHPVPVVHTPRRAPSLSWLPSMIQPIAQLAASALLVTVLGLFFLVQRESVRDRVIGLAGRRQLTTTTRALQDAAHRVSHYLLLQLCTNTIIGLGVTIGLYFIGIPYSPLWGLLTVALRFLPYVGIWLAALFPFTVALTLFSDWGHALLVLAVYGGLDGIMTNILEPLLFGHGTGVSSMALLVAAAFWAFLWGPIGLLMAVPLTVCVVVLGEHVPSLAFLHTLLGEAPDVDPAARFYYRVLARDHDGAAVLLEAEAATKPLPAIYDEVILPALSYAKAEHEQGELSTTEERRIFRVTREMLDGVLANYRISAPVAGCEDLVHVIGCATRGYADSLALRMLRDVARPVACEVEIVAAARFVQEVAERSARGEKLTAVIGAVAPGGLSQAAGLCKQLRAKAPKVRVIVGWWGAKPDTTEAEKLLHAAGAERVTWNLRETIAALAPEKAAKPTTTIPA
jgi:predicted PurR-regulated permease PerM